LKYPKCYEQQNIGGKIKKQINMKLETIYIKTKTGATNEWTIEVVDNKYRSIAGQIDGKMKISEWTIVYGKNTGKSNETTDNEQCMKEAVAKRTKKLESGYFENIKHINKTQYFEPMLASKWEDSRDKIIYPVYSQPKLDGIRCVITRDGMFSRNGKPIISAPHIIESLSEVFDQHPDLILDGELYADKFANDFNKIVSLVKKTKPTDADLKESKKNIQYWIYDIPSEYYNFGERCYRLDVLFDNYLAVFEKHCVLVDTHTCNNEDEVMELYGEYVNKGFEGQMLRIDGKYENKRSKSLMKHKSFVDEEYTILDIVEGEGNRTGTAGYMVFETENGDRFKSNVKGTWEETAEMLKNKKKLIGKQATIKYFNLTPAGIPRFPFVTNIDRNSYE
jgi:ATP-dependent DNA ligase